MGRDLGDQVAIVTGAARGIGEAIARAFADAGTAVVVADIDVVGAKEVALAIEHVGGDARAVGVDISDPDSARQLVDEAIRWLGHVDILVNNAAIDAPLGEALEITDEHWRDVIDTNLTGQWWCTRAILPHMVARGRGRIIFISSVSARLGEPDLSVAYNAAKAGLIGLTIGLSTQVEQYGIRVNAVAPGPTGTGRPLSDEQRTLYERSLPLGLGGPEPVAQACLYLARSSGDWISGAVLNVSGGLVRG